MTPTTKTGNAAWIDTLDAATIRDNLPAVAPSPAELVVAALADESWLDVADGHIGGTVQPRLPRLLLNRKAGQAESGFTDELTGEHLDSIRFVWLADTMTRAWWPDPFGKGDKAPACRSRDGITPDPASPQLQAATCAACPHSQWVNGETPACNSAIEVMVYLLDQQRLSLARFGGMAVSRVTRYLGALNAHIPRRPPLAYVTCCELEAVDTDNGTFLVPRFSVAGEIARSEATPLIAMRDEKVAEWVEQIATEAAEGAGRDDTAPAAAAAAGPFDDESEF